MLKSFLCLLLSLTTAFGGSTSIFDGKTFTGWEGETSKVWWIVDGVIVGGSLEGNPQNEFLATQKQYQNFRLTLEYKLNGTEGFVNGGVQFRSVRIKEPPNEMFGYQADIGAGYSGCLYDESRRKTMLSKPAEDLIQKAEKPGEWNTYEIRAEGPRIQLFVNGVRTVDYTEAMSDIAVKGNIALQIHGKCKAEISFRNIQIEELSGTDNVSKLRSMPRKPCADIDLYLPGRSGGNYTHETDHSFHRSYLPGGDDAFQLQERGAISG